MVLVILMVLQVQCHLYCLSDQLVQYFQESQYFPLVQQVQQGHWLQLVQLDLVSLDSHYFLVGLLDLQGRQNLSLLVVRAHPKDLENQQIHLHLLVQVDLLHLDPLVIQLVLGILVARLIQDHQLILYFL